MQLSEYIQKMDKEIKQNHVFLSYTGIELIEKQTLIHDFSKFLLSVYVYLEERNGKCDIEIFKKYLKEEVLNYWYRAMTPDYHKVMCGKMFFGGGSGRPLTLCKDIYLHDADDIMTFGMGIRAIIDIDIVNIISIIEGYLNENN